MAEYRSNSVEINNVEVVNFDGSKTINLQRISAEINVYEDMGKPTMYGNAVLYDAMDLIQEFPFIGEETINISFKVPGDETSFKRTFSIYKISDVDRDENDAAQVYVLHFTSKETIDDPAKSVWQSYSGKIDDTVRKVFDTYFDTDKVINIEETKSTQSLIIPDLTPIETMIFLSKRAWSLENDSSNFVFFEDHEGFNFRTIEHYIQQPIKQSYHYAPVNVDSRNQGTYNQDVHLSEPYAVISFSLGKVRDNLNNINSGMYGGTHLVYDMIAKSFKNYKFDYDKNFASQRGTKHLEKNKLKSPNVNFGEGQRIFGTTDALAQNINYVKNNGSVKPKHWENFLLQRRSSMVQYDNIVLDMTIPGDHTRKPGDVIYFRMPSATNLEETNRINKYYSGKYLVTRVRHKINQETYTTIMQVVKDSTMRKITSD